MNPQPCGHRTNSTIPVQCHNCTHGGSPGTLCRHCGTRMTLPHDHAIGAHLECACHHLDLKGHHQ